jgi:hypothetical protein
VTQYVLHHVAQTVVQIKRFDDINRFDAITFVVIRIDRIDLEELRDGIAAYLLKVCNLDLLVRLRAHLAMNLIDQCFGAAYLLHDGVCRKIFLKQLAHLR